MTALELRPDGRIENFVKVTSAYPKKALQNLINESDILYVDPNKKKNRYLVSSPEAPIAGGGNQVWFYWYGNIC